MRDWALKYMRCPHCGSELDCHVFETAPDGHILSGVLITKEPGCNEWYPIVRGIPRMLPINLRESMTKDFIYSFQTQLTGLGLIQKQQIPSQDSLQSLKLHTIQNFGFEWLEYARYGWDDPEYNTRIEEKVFLRKSLLKAEDISGKLVLDAGCGNGRYTNWASKYGGRVFGMDLGDGVESAFKNTRELSTITIVQGDIFAPPFSDVFEVIFSIGVLMHTGDAQRATFSLAGKVQPGGSLTVHLYGKGNPVYEFVDWHLRRYTTRMSIERLQSFTNRAFHIQRFLRKLKLTYLTDLFIRLDPHPHCIFDWYAAPIATHHTFDEIFRWFDTINMKVIATNKDGLARRSGGVRGLLRDLHRKLRPATVTVRAIRPTNNLR